MKTKSILFFFLLICGIITTGCNQKRQYRPERSIIKAFNQTYPEATRIEWEQKKGYEVAEFHDNGTKKEAWFDQNGKWMMTESKLKYNALPKEIRDGFEKSIYNSWRKEDIEKIEQTGMQPVYILEIEKSGLETDLYYTESGTLAEIVSDIRKEEKQGYTPISASMSVLVKQKYPDATIIKSELEKGRNEIDILDNGKSKEVIFNDSNWVSTSWEISKAEVPTLVMETFRKSAYGKYAIDDLHFIETPYGSYYHFELEQGGREVYLSIDTNGKIME